MGLKKLGLSDYESKIYEALLYLGRADAKSVSKASKVPPTAVYPNLKSLEKKGFVEIIQGENYLYEAVPPRKALDSLEEQKIEEFKSEKERAIAELEKNSTAPADFDPVKLFYGKEVSRQVFQQQISKAKKTAYIAGWKFSKAKDAQGLIRHTKDAASRKVDVRIIFTHHTEVADYIAGEVQKYGVKVKFLNIGNFSIMMFDNELCKISLKSEDRKKRISIMMEDKDLSSAMTEYYNIIWKRAKN